jgi:hypothetical protein
MSRFFVHACKENAERSDQEKQLVTVGSKAADHSPLILGTRTVGTARRMLISLSPLAASSRPMRESWSSILVLLIATCSRRFGLDVTPESGTGNG